MGVVLLILGSIAVTLVAAETYFYFKLKSLPVNPNKVSVEFSYQPREGYTKELVELQNRMQQELGPMYKVFTKMKHKKMINDEILWDQTYTTDKHGRRISFSEQPKDKHLLFFGGSFALGEGLADNQTSASLIEQYNPSIHSYNFGARGAGTSHMYVLLRDFIQKEDILEDKGAAVYLYNHFHVNRVTGSMSHTSWNEGDSPYLYINDKNEVVADGKFSTKRTFITKLYQLLNMSSTLGYFKVNLPFTEFTPEEDYQNFLFRVIEASADLYKEKFGSDNFFVIIYPGNPNKEQVIKFLEEKNIKYLDYTNIFDYSQGEEYSFKDGHPNLKGSEVLAEQLEKDLAKVFRD